MHIEVATRLQQTEEYYFSKKLREIDELNRSGAEVINLGIGSPDLPPHDLVIKALSNHAVKHDVHAYQGYKGIPVLRQAISNWYKRYYQVEANPETEILPLIGSKEGIMHICMTYLEKGDEALIPNPGYPTYSAAVKLSGATAVTYPLKEKNDWLPDLKELEKRNLSKVKIMWVNYPHMPTGKSADKSFFVALIAFAKKHNILICHDNPYSFVLTDSPTSLLSVDGAKEVVIELNSLSKSSNMAGWRIGMMIASSDRISDVLRFKSNMDSGMFLPLQMAAVAALELDQSWYDELNKIYFQRRVKVYTLLDSLNCAYDKNQVGMFVWAKIPNNYTSGYQLSDEILQKAAVFITPGGIFGSEGDQYIRISLCTKQNILQKAIDRISAI